MWKSKSGKSIAFPAIPCGAYGYPIREAAEISIDVCGDSRFKDIAVYFYLYGQKTYGIWRSVLCENRYVQRGL